MNQRLKSIDYIKCLACLLILNSHVGVLYPDTLQKAAGGGYFGNSLFFFVSGYCLLNIRESFPKWYLKRIIRVYISYALTIPFLYFAGIFDGQSVLDILLPYKSYHFIPTILILYAFFYLAIYFNHKGVRFWYMELGLVVLILAYYFLFYDYQHGYIYAHFSFMEMTSYMVTMLIGASVAKHGTVRRKSVPILITVVSYGVFVYQKLFYFPRILSILLLLIGIAFSWGIGNIVTSVEKRLPRSRVVQTVAAVTLEAYIVHYILIQPYKMVGFPTNLLFFFLSVFGIAYSFHEVAKYLTGYINRKMTGD